jgi:hypothetical protein
VSRRSVQRRSRGFGGGSIDWTNLAAIDPLAPEPIDRRAPIHDRILAALVTWNRPDGTTVEPRTGDIAARLDIRPQSPERRALNNALTDLKRARKIAFEQDPRDGQNLWRLTDTGRAAAVSLTTGTAGFERRG